MPKLNSSNIGEAAYDCRRDIYEALIASPSPGSFFHRNVKDVYRSTKVS